MACRGLSGQRCQPSSTVPSPASQQPTHCCNGHHPLTRHDEQRPTLTMRTAVSIRVVVLVVPDDSGNGHTTQLIDMYHCRPTQTRLHLVSTVPLQTPTRQPDFHPDAQHIHKYPSGGPPGAPAESPPRFARSASPVYPVYALATLTRSLISKAIHYPNQLHACVK